MAKILIIDDSFLTRKMTGRVLREIGHDVIESETGIDGLEKAAAEAPDAIILDLLMPVMPGLTVLEELKNRGLTMPVVVCTADIQQTTQDMCIAAGAAGFINKPISMRAAEEMLKKIL